MKKGWIIVLVVVVLIALYVGTSYNSFVTQNERIDAAWAQVESQYQRRFDLIGNLVASVKGVFNQEQVVFDNIAKARAAYSGARTVDEKISAANQVEAGLGRLLAVVEQYPTLRSVETVQSLMVEIAGTENRISVERMRFNEQIMSYNTSIKRFPAAAVAALFGFDERIYFEAEAGSEKAPTVDFTK